MSISIQAGQVRALAEALEQGGVPDEHSLHLIPADPDWADFAEWSEHVAADDVIVRLSSEESLVLRANSRVWEVRQ